MRDRFRCCLEGSLLLAFLVQFTPAQAQTYPAKPIRIIVPTSPGGLNDLLSRSLAQQISSTVGQPVVVENRPGGGNIIGMQILAKSPSDGYTLGVATYEPLVYNPLLYSKLPYDPDKDFSYVTHLVRALGIIVANESVPGSTFPEMIAHVKSNPGKLNWATWGPGSTPALYLEWIKIKNGVEMMGIPYKGAGPSIPALVSGQVHLSYSPIGPAMPYIQSGKLKALAITGTNHVAALPNVPHLSQYNGAPDFAGGFSVYAPAKTPTAILERLSAEFRKALVAAPLQKIMAGTMEPVGSTPAEFAAQIKQEKANAAIVFKTLGIRPTSAPE